MRRSVIAIAVLALAAPACSQASDLVSDAQEQVSDAAQTAEFCISALRLANAVEARDVDAIVDAGEALVDDAPDEIRGDAEFLLDAGRQAQAGDAASLDGDDVTAAGERVRSFTEDRCNPLSDDT